MVLAKQEDVGHQVVVESREEASWCPIARGKLAHVSERGKIVVEGEFGVRFVFDDSPRLRVTRRD